MSKRRLIDTNLIIRHLVHDHPQHARIAAKLFAASDQGELTLVILPTVLAECVFVLESFYGHSRSRIATVLTSLASSPGIELADLAHHLEALHRYQHGKLHFVDCLLAAHAVVEHIPLATFDNGIKKMKDVTIVLN